MLSTFSEYATEFALRLPPDGCVGGAARFRGEAQAGGYNEPAEPPAQVPCAVERRLRIGPQQLDALGGEKVPSLDVNRMHGLPFALRRVS